ncbi:spherulation-specific family 4 protein [Streptomyces xanthochromogenes]
MTLPPTMGAGVPMYVHPAVAASGWAALTIAGAPVHWVILNQDTGPGDPEDDVLGDAARETRDAGIRVLGYITLSYSSRDDFFNNQDADTWHTRGFTGSFLDECPSDQAHLEAVALTVIRQREHGMDFVVLNPGVVPVRGYADIADQIVVFEQDLEAWRGATFPDWMREYPPERFAALIHGVTTADEAADCVRLARQRGIHTVFCHSTTYVPQTNTWDGLPSYWQDLSRDLAAYPSRPAPGWGA